ncbi:MAG: TIGR04282 family arsenosugar biosynthesis glycosyltransferase [Deltaproteobacteria bacterium]|nr:TIGR04282 family arsenosugar biosynthesis glycosyltransferase [Deltaproteobacteria bacterium]MBW1962998.1 TIGR04282 family arsenosugar biosynthesis glycosyltransferase [Deltaproteobacteria bacterium]MBW1993171.1 TIGR04282 family arsenosugar biosynthesis glycosyltransferase [Deltaproteobacteria bacterium]MBW2151819.1 TIGR04282 family arsenosugar biosynthesis glycosyltransferase [Deltaproteobacteria bacterium]
MDDGPHIISDEREIAIVFLRAPTLGQVKTRLIKHLDSTWVLRLYKSFSLDVIEAVRKQIQQVRICYFPADRGGLVKEWLGHTFEYEPQTGRDLGERIKNAFLSAFSDGFCRVVLVGTDIPELSQALIAEAFQKLQNHLSVIGPSYDGGYYLIGFHRDGFKSQVFDEIQWGSSEVFNKTLSILNKLNLKTHILPVCRDIDTFDDLMDMIKNLKPKKNSAKNTAACLKSLGFI